jgi:hypothetical protein
MMLKIYHRAITKFANVPQKAGASAMFKLFQARPALLEKRLKRPAVAPAAGGGTGSCAVVVVVAVSQEQKRRRL